VQPGTQVKAPFRVVSLPAGLTASVVVNGPWGKDADARWASFLKSVVEQGYVPAGPTMEIWSADAGQGTQSTEMRMPDYPRYRRTPPCSSRRAGGFSPVPRLTGKSIGFYSRPFEFLLVASCTPEPGAQNHDTWLGLLDRVP
jgi:hypothetical protein